MGLKEFIIGDYDWTFLCTPRLPWGALKPAPPLFKRDDKISMFVAFVMGLQHALAMVAGIITVPLILSGPYFGDFSADKKQYVIAASLIASGFSTIIQVTQIPIPFTGYVIGSGLLSVMGVSFTFLPIAQTTIPILRACTCNGVSCITGTPSANSDPSLYCVNCSVKTEGNCYTGSDAFGKILGTIMVACILEICISLLPPAVLRKIFPPVVTGTTVTLIGFALTAAGFKSWGGGAYCADQVLTSKPLCDNNGDVQLPFGSKQYVGLGFVVFSTLLIVELFGSPFLRNISVVMGLLFGMIVASSTHLTQCVPGKCTYPKPCPCFSVLPGGLSYNNATGLLTGTANGSFYSNTTVCPTTCAPTSCLPEVCTKNRYVTSRQIDSAKWITFMWVEHFNLGFYAPVLLPLLFGFMVSTMECVGDVTATMEASGLTPVGPEFERAVQGGILSDGLSCLWAASASVLPTVTYAENNGIISLTRCGARRAGWACGGILVVLGVLAKFAGIILSIPDCVLGGMTTFLFINVAVSGFRILTMGDGINRRNRFICAMAMAIGVGVSVVPQWVNIFGQFDYPLEGNLWKINPAWSKGYRGFRDALIVVLSNGFSIGGFIALLLNLILPYDRPDIEEAEHDTAYSTGTADRNEKHFDEYSKPADQRMDDL